MFMIRRKNNDRLTKEIRPETTGPEKYPIIQHTSGQKVNELQTIPHTFYSSSNIPILLL